MWLNRIAQIYRNDAKKKHFGYRLALVFSHAIFLLILTILLQYTSIIRKDEISFLKWAAIVKHNVLNVDPKPELDGIIFLNVAKDLELTNSKEYGPLSPGMRGAVETITDRRKLSILFDTLNNHSKEYKYVICDILFEEKAMDDSELRYQSAKMQHIITAATYEKDLIAPVFAIPFGVVNFEASNKTTFTKMPIFYGDSIKSLPALLYESLTKNKFSKRSGITLLNGRPTFNTIIPEFYYRKTDLHYSPTPENRINTYYLGQLMLLPDFFQVLKNKIIVIGDFTNTDNHTTYLGSMPGPLILLNTYLTLKKKPITISLVWLGLLFTTYLLISYWLILHPDRKLNELHDRVKSKVKVSFVNKFILKYLSFAGLFILLNMVSYYYFGTYISLFYLVTYLTLLQLIIDKWPHWLGSVNAIFKKLQIKGK